MALAPSFPSRPSQRPQPATAGSAGARAAEVNRAERTRLNGALASLADGDRRAFHAVYALAQPAVLQLTRRLLRGDPEHEDVAQQALLKVFERASEYDPNRNAMPWILGIAAWEVRSHRKRHFRRREEQMDEALQCASESPESWVVARDLREAVIAVIGELKPQDTETLAVAMGYQPRPNLPSATFRKRLQRAMTRLKAAWEARHAG